MGSAAVQPNPEVKTLQKKKSLEFVKQQLSNKNFGSALTSLKQLVTDPSVEIYESIGNTYESLKLHQKAKQAYEKFLQYLPDNPNILTKLGIIYDQLNEPEKSISLLKKVHQLSPSIQSTNYLACIQFKEGLCREAISHFDYVIEKANENKHSLKGSGQFTDIVSANLYNNYGNSLRYDNKYEEAIEYYEKSIQLNKQNPLFYVNCALALANPAIQNYQGAYQYLVKAERLLQTGEQQDLYVLARVQDFRQDIQEWNFKRKHNYTTAQQKKALNEKITSLQNHIGKLFSTDLDNEIMNISMLSEEYDSLLKKVCQVWRQKKMNMANIFDVDAEIFQLFIRTSTNFALIPFKVLVYAIQSKKQGHSFSETQINIRQTLMKLSLKYPPSNSTHQIQSKIKSFCIEEQKWPDMFENDYFSKYENLVNEILRLASKAEKVYEQFDSFAKNICLRKGHNFKSGLKFPREISVEQQSKIIIRVTEKIFKELSNKKEQILNYLDNKTKDLDIINIPIIAADFLSIWRQIILNILQERIAKKQKTYCYIYDLVRGKCMYQNLSDLEYTAQNLMNQCQENHYQVIQCDNRLHKSTKDLNFKIKIKDIVCELQLALQFDSSLNQFSHGLYQILRSPGGCVFGSIIWLGKLKEIKFMRDINRLHQQVEYMSEQNPLLYSQKLDYEYVLKWYKNLQ